MSFQPEGYLYIIRSEEGPIKIGISIDPKSRIARVSATSGRAIVSSFISPLVPMSDKLEQLLHKQFRADRSVGEWFDTPFDVAVKAAHQLGMIHFPDHWKRSEQYVQGVMHRDRLYKFTSPTRTQGEWDAFYAGMGDEAIALIRLADEMDDKAMLSGAMHLQQVLNTLADAAALLGLEPPALPENVMADLERLRAEMDQDMKDAGLKLE